MVWSKFLGLVSELNITDFLNFEIVAQLLQQLSDLYEIKPKRKVPKNLDEAKPNLIVCPEKEVHSVCLMLYAYDRDKPLPSTDEILICTPQTSLEQIELICRRAFHDTKGKMFTILHAEHINYESSVHVEKLFMETTVTN